jgi:hypothetical protein
VPVLKSSWTSKAEKSVAVEKAVEKEAVEASHSAQDGKRLTHVSTSFMSFMSFTAVIDMLVMLFVWFVEIGFV